MSAIQNVKYDPETHPDSKHLIPYLGAVCEILQQ